MMMMTTTATSSSSKPARHAKLLAGSIDVNDSMNQSLTHASKKHTSSTRLIERTQFDSKSFVNKSDGFSCRDDTKHSMGDGKGMVPILIVSKSKKLINKYQIDAANNKTKLNYIKSLNQNQIKINPNKQHGNDSHNSSQISSARENYNYEYKPKVKAQLLHAQKAKVCYSLQKFISTCSCQLYIEFIFILIVQLYK